MAATDPITDDALRSDVTDIRGDIRELRAETTRTGKRVAGLTVLTSAIAAAVIGTLISQGALWYEMGKLGGRLDGISAQLGQITTLLQKQARG
jgi:hypothetical protein